MANPRHEVAVVTYGRADALAALLRALRAQTRPPDRIVVVDDTPDDSVRQVAEAERAAYHRNPGPASIAGSRNRAIDVTGGDLLTFLDSDAEPAPDYLQRIQDALAADPRAIAALGHVAGLPPMGPTKQAIGRLFGLNVRTKDEPPRVLWNLNTTYPVAPGHDLDADLVWGCNLTVRREAFAKARFEPQFVRYSLYDDIDFGLSLQEAFPERTIRLVRDARIRDARNEHGRIGFDDVLHMRTVHRMHVLRKHGRLPRLAVPRLLWTDLGGLLIKARADPQDVLPGLRGLWRGWWAVARHRKDLRRGDLRRLNQGYRFMRQG